jgi:hypothetical protein
MMNRLNNEGPKEGSKEEYVQFLAQKQDEFNQHISSELAKVQKQKKDSRIVKAKCFGVLQLLFEKQVDLLVGKRLSFDYEVAVRAIRADLKIYGAPREHISVVKENKWPYFEAYRNPTLKVEEQEALLKDLRITKIEWATGDTIRTLRFSFNNGQTTPMIGSTVPVLQSFVL